MLEKLDAALHWLHIPHWLMAPICDRYDKQIMGPDDLDAMCPNCCTPWKCNGPHLPTKAH